MPRDGTVSASEPGARFGRSRRLLRAADFNGVLAGRGSLRGVCFELHYRKTERPGPARLGLIVPKRLVPTAVTRNSIKRHSREAFRLMCDLPQGGDFVLRARHGASISKTDPRAWRREIEGLLAKFRRRDQ